MGSSKLHFEVSFEDVAYDTAVNKNEVESEKALLKAAIEGDYDKIEQLLKSGICVDAKEYNKLLFYDYKNYHTPLQFATLHGHDKCVQLLVDHGADVNAKDLYGLTSLHLAACSGAHNILKILLKARAACSLPVKFSYSISLKFSTGTGCCKVPYLDGTTPLHVAAANNNVDCVKELIRYGADFNAVDEHGRTSLYIAAQHGYSECVLVHLKEAIGRDILSLPSLKTSDTPLHFAVKYQMVDCIKELLRLGSDVNHKNFDGLSPLHIALLPINSNTPDLMTILKLLVFKGHNTDINLPDWEGFTPLHYACFYGHRNMWSRRPEIATFLIKYGANVNIEDCDSCSLLVRELRYHPEENFEILRYLVKSLLYLPPLKSLNITYDPEVNLDDEIQQLDLADEEEPENNFDFDENPFDHQIMLEPPDFYSEAEHVELTPGMLFLPERFQRPNNGNAVSLDRDEAIELHERMHVMDVTDYHDDPLLDLSIHANRDPVDYSTASSSSLILKKQQWYEAMASKPRTLQHHCRFLIRKMLGPMKLKYIKDLSLPPKLHSYLLFELEEDTD